MREDNVVSARESHFKGDAPVELQYQRINDDEVIKTFMNNKEIRDNRNIQVKRVDEGVLVSFFNETTKPLFEGSSGDDLALSDYGRIALSTVGTLLARYNSNSGNGSPIEIIGHAPKGVEDPWSISGTLSSLVFSEVLNSGVKESQVVKIVGAGDSTLFDPEDPQHIKNRRFEILIRTKPEE